MKPLIIIPSRMASSRFPGKPMVIIDGIPMIQRVWEKAINSKLGEVIVACSENEVFDLISNLGGKAIITDPDLPSGTDRIYSALNKLKNKIYYDCIINLQGDMPLIEPYHIKKVIEPLKHNFSIGTLSTKLNEAEKSNPNVTKVIVDWNKNNLGQAIEFFRIKKNMQNNTYHHVGIYSYTQESLSQFISLPKSKNENLLNLEQYRAMDAGMSIGVVYEEGIPLGVDTKEDLITVESIIREKNEKN